MTTRPSSPSSDERAEGDQTDDDSVTAIVGLAAHELKNALGGIGVALARCEQKLLGGKPVTRDDVSLARAELRRLSTLVNDMLDGTRVDRGEVHIERVPVDLSALVTEIAATTAAAHERPVALDLPPEPSVTIDCDPERVRAVLVNFLANAAKYAPAPAAIGVSIRRALDTRHVRLAVHDEGPGVPAEDQPSIFEKFFRSPSVARQAHGLGLGLYLCRAIARAHGGAVGVDSTPGAGATFWLDLPDSGSDGGDADPEGGAQPALSSRHQID